MVGFRENHPFRGLFCHIVETAQHFIVQPHPFTKNFAVLFPVGNGFPGNSRRYRRFGNCWCNNCQQPVVEWFWNDIIAAETQPFQVISGIHHIGNCLFCQISNSTDSGNLHLFVNAGSTDIQRPTENIGKTQHIVYLVGMIGTSRRKNNIFPGGDSQFIRYFRIRVRQCEDNRIFIHRLNHFNGQHIGHRKSEKDIRPCNSFC